MTDYKGPNAFSNEVFKPAKAPKIIPPYQRAPGGVVRNADGPAFNNRFPKSRYRGGGQSGLVPVLEVAGGGGGGYVAKAVHFDGATFLANNALVSTDSAFLSFSYWINAVDPGSGQNLIWVIDPVGSYFGYNIIYNDPFAGAWEVNLNSGDYAARNKSANPLSYGSWHIISGKVQVDQGSPPQIVQLYIDDIDVGQIFASSSAFSILTNGLPFYFGSDTFGDNLTGDIADFWFAPGLDIDFSDVAIRRLFISALGKPVNPSGFPAGGAILFSGDATTFANNQLGGGPFVTTGTLTNATTSPSD